MDTTTFISQVDVDGDGHATLADRMALDLWILEGGDLDSAIAGAIQRDNGTYDLRPFFDELALQNASQAPAEPLESGGEGGGEGLLQGGDNCNYVEGQELPPYAEVVPVDLILATPCVPPQMSKPSQFPCRDAADADDNGMLNIADAVRLLDYLFGTPPGPPTAAPGPTNCGFDPTPDALDCVAAGVGCP